MGSFNASIGYMSDDKIQYDILALDAMRGVIRTVLQRVQRRGLPGDHHFFIAFATRAPGVLLSKRLKERYPEEMTVVMQHQFWDLQVTEDRFEVKLSFNNVPERLVIPFSAIRRFHDPSVDFGFNLQMFDPAAAAHVPSGGRGSTNENAGRHAPVTPVLADPLPHVKELPREVAAAVKDTSIAVPVGPEQENLPEDAKKGAEIVKLDSFRKK